MGVREVSSTNVKDDNPTKPAWRWLPGAEGKRCLKKLQVPEGWWVTKHCCCGATNLALSKGWIRQFFRKNGGPPKTQRQASRSILRPGSRGSSAKLPLRVVSELPDYACESSLGTREAGLASSILVEDDGHYKFIFGTMSPPGPFLNTFGVSRITWTHKADQTSHPQTSEDETFLDRKANS